MNNRAAMALGNKGHDSSDSGMARPSIDHQHGRLYSLGAQPVQRLLAGLMQCQNCFGGIMWISVEREQYCSESTL
jgi:hypothetical protein